MIRKKNIKTISSMVIILFLLINLLPTMSGKEIETFSNEGGLSNITYDLKFDTETEIATEASGYFKIPTNRGEIKSASLKIKCLPDTDDKNSYLKDPRLDIGIDGDYEWRFNEKGFGDPGHQYEFSTGTPRRLVMTANHGAQNFDNRSYILIPTTAEIQSASMDIHGGPGQYTEDIIVAMYYYNAKMYYTKSNRDGTFTTLEEYADLAPGYSYGVGLGDFDDDNDLDIIYGVKQRTSPAADFYYLRNIGASPAPWGSNPIMDQVIIGSIPATGSNYPRDITVEDFNGDGILDFITSIGGTLYLFKGTGDGNFEIPVTLSVSYSGTAYGKDAADFNNDGYMDFVVCGSSGGSVMYFEGRGDGTFKSPVSVPLGKGTSQYAVIAGDFNDDYNPDIISKGRESGSASRPYQMTLAKGNGDGTFEDGVDTNIDPYAYYGPYSGDGFDFNYDGYQDVIINRYRYLYYYESLGNGNFKAGKDLGFISYSYSTATSPRVSLGGCQNLEFNIGEDGTTERTFTGEFGDFTKKVNFGNELQSLIDKPNNGFEIVTDEYGNKMYKVPIRFDSDTIGSVMLQNLDIKYEYTATVEQIPPERYNLTTDLNDLLPTDNNKSQEINVYLAIYSDTPGSVVLSDLSIEYNGAPECAGIGMDNYHVFGYEDHDGIALVNNSNDSEEEPIELNLTHYFTDDYDNPNNLTYEIYSNSDPKHIELSLTDEFLLHVNSTLVKDWFGTAQVEIRCSDSEGIETKSNEFEIHIEPVNDPPVANNPLPNINVREKHAKTPIDLDDPNKEYFTDIDNEVLYYRAILLDPEEYGDHLNVSVDPTTNLLYVTSISGYAQNIEVGVYCHDNIDILTMSPSELVQIIDVYQILLVNITSFSDTFPPQWLPITIPPIPEDEPKERILNLKDYVFDPDDGIKNLTFSIYSLSKSGYIDVRLDEDGYLSVYPKNDFDDTAKLTLAVTDDEHNYDLTTVPISIIPSNDLPIVDIVEPGNGSKVYGMAEIIGSAYDAENELEKVEICIGDDGVWEPVNGSTYWTYDLDVTSYLSKHKGANMLLVKARAEDGTGNKSFLDKAYLYIGHSTADGDGDGIPDYIDRFPNNPSEWEDSDNDGHGDNSDKFPNDVTQWNDTDNDGFGDNPNGNSPDRFTYDPTQWEDLDCDGHGDNPWGNVGDHYRNDPERWKGKDTAGAQTETAWENNIFLLMILGLIITLILTVLIFIRYVINLNRSKKIKD